MPQQFEESSEKPEKGESSSPEMEPKPQEIILLLLQSHA